MKTEKHTSVGRDVRILSNMLRRRMDASSLKSTLDTLTGTHGYVLKYLIENQHRDVFQRDIESAFSVRRSTATIFLQRMEKNGLILRRPVDYDARLKKIVLTEKAYSFDRLIKKEIEENEDILIRGIPAEDIAVFRRTLKKMKENLENTDGIWVSPPPHERKKSD